MPFATLEKRRAYNKAYREKNQERLNAANKAYYQENRDKITAQKRIYTQLNKEKASKWYKKYKDANQDKVKEWAAKRRAMIAGTATGKVSYKAILALGMICGICELPIFGKYHFDHIVPLAAGGTHTQDNIQLAHPSCNMSKGAKLK